MADGNGSSLGGSLICAPVPGLPRFLVGCLRQARGGTGLVRASDVRWVDAVAAEDGFQHGEGLASRGG